MVWKPTGSCKPPFTGGGIALLSSSWPSACSLAVVLFVLRLVRVPIAASEPSPSSSITVPLLAKFSGAAALDLVRGRFAGGLPASACAADFLCLLLVTSCEAESAASSPEASREEGWRRSAVEDCLIEDGAGLRFRLPEPDDEGEDMTKLWVAHDKNRILKCGRVGLYQMLSGQEQLGFSKISHFQDSWPGSSLLQKIIDQSYFSPRGARVRCYQGKRGSGHAIYVHEWIYRFI